VKTFLANSPLEKTTERIKTFEGEVNAQYLKQAEISGTTQDWCVSGTGGFVSGFFACFHYSASRPPPGFMRLIRVTG